MGCVTCEVATPPNLGGVHVLVQRAMLSLRHQGLAVANKIPNSVIGAVASVISKHYYSHSKLES